MAKPNQASDTTVEESAVGNDNPPPFRTAPFICTLVVCFAISLLVPWIVFANSDVPASEFCFVTHFFDVLPGSISGVLGAYFARLYSVKKMRSTSIILTFGAFVGVSLGGTNPNHSIVAIVLFQLAATLLIGFCFRRV